MAGVIPLGLCLKKLIKTAQLLLDKVTGTLIIAPEWSAEKDVSCIGGKTLFVLDNSLGVNSESEFIKDKDQLYQPLLLE